MRGRQYHTLLLFHKSFKPSQTCESEINLYPKFYQELISLCIKEPVHIAEILSQPIWHNHFLQNQDSSLFYPELYNRGISCIRDIVDEQIKFLTWCLANEKYGLQNQHFLSWLSTLLHRSWRCQEPSVRASSMADRATKVRASARKNTF